MYNRPLLHPRNGSKLVVLVVCRISGCNDQTEVSLDDQQDHARDEIAKLYKDKGPIDFRTISTIGKGEWSDRPELAEIERQIRSRELDVLICEDLGRIIRGVDAVKLCGLAFDAGTRVLSPNDDFDTVDNGWEADVIRICQEHVGHNEHTAKRLKQKLMNRFEKGIGACARPIYGYRVPDGATSYAKWEVDPEAAKHILAGKELLSETLNCSAVSDYFNKLGVPVGPYCRNSKWDGAMVRRYFANQLLKGIAHRGKRRTVKHHETGHRISVLNPEGPTTREYPHLQIIDPIEFDELNTRLDQKNAGFSRKKGNRTDSRIGVPRKRTRFPGQYGTCWYCGRHYVWGGNGVSQNLQCNGSRLWKCWNSVGIDGPRLVREIMGELKRFLTSLRGFDEQFRRLLSEANANIRVEAELEQTRQNVSALTRQIDNLVRALAELGPTAELKVRHDNLVAERSIAEGRQRQLEQSLRRELQLPQSVDELTALIDSAFADLAEHSPEVGDVLRQVIPELRFYLVRLCDGGYLLPRAEVTLDLSSIAPDLRRFEGVSERLATRFVVDLFDPPQRERFRSRVMELRRQGMSERDVVAKITEETGEYVTVTAIQRAASLQRKMDKRGLTSPYVVVTDLPQDPERLRRAQHSRYHFEPQEGYEQHPIQ